MESRRIAFPVVSGERYRPTTGTVVGFGALLTVLVIGVVPAVAVATGVHPVFVLALGLGGYCLAVLVADDAVAGIVAAVPVLATVNADVPLRRGPSRTVDLAIVIGDFAVLAAIVLLLVGWSATRGARARGEWVQPSWRTLGWPWLFLTGFAIWALVGAAFAAHDARTAAAFGLTQFRYVAYFAVAAGLAAVGYATLRALAGALVVAVLGHAAFALAQFAYGGSFGVSALGELQRTNELTIGLLGREMPMGRFLGGLVGNNAAFASIAIPAAAVLVWVAVDDRGLVRWLAVLGVVAIGALCLPLSQYDSVRVAFFLTLGLAVVLASLGYWPRPVREFVERNRGTLLAGSVAGGIGIVTIAAIVGIGRILAVVPLVEGSNLDTRLADYQTAFELALEHPIFGYGGGNVEPVGPELGFSDDIAIHSLVYEYLAETGFVGIALWLAALGATARRAVGLAWSEHPDATVAAALCVGATGFLVVGMLDQVWDNHTSIGVFWLFGGAIAGRYWVLARDGPGTAGRSR